MQLPPDQLQELLDVLRDAFNDRDSFALCVRLGTGKSLDAITGPKGLNALYLPVIEWAEAHDRVTELIAAARVVNPTNRQLQTFTERFRLPQAVATREALCQPQQGFTHMSDWLHAVKQIMPSICLIEAGAQQQIGTGFLVEDGLVVTNCHVVRALFADSVPQQAVPLRDRVTFDHYRSLEDGRPLPPVICPFRPEWHAASSPEDQLDFALVRVNLPTPRPFSPRTPLPPGRPAVDQESVCVFGHPGGGLMTWSSGHIEHIDRANGLLSHTANTGQGSSGAPVLTADLKLVGLHWGHRQGSNRASLISSIVARLGGRWPT
jgi:S1-C subfamily serine protease